MKATSSRMKLRHWALVGVLLCAVAAGGVWLLSGGTSAQQKPPAAKANVVKKGNSSSPSEPAKKADEASKSEPAKGDQLFPPDPKQLAAVTQGTEVAKAAAPPKSAAVNPPAPNPNVRKDAKGEKKAAPRPRLKPRLKPPAAVTPAVAATAPAETPWARWNVAPYATSFEEACRKAPAAIDGFNMPTAVKEAFKQQLGADCRGGKEVWLVPHQSLQEMWSGGREPHVMKNVTVGELPVLQSPDGRPYRKGSVAETAKALQWTQTYEGKVYVLDLPFVCFNWAWSFGTPVTTAEQCYELTFEAPVGGKARWWVATATGAPLPPSACNAQKQGDGAWTAWYGQCDTCRLTDAQTEHAKKLLGGSIGLPHRFVYSVTAEKQVLRFSSAIAQGTVVLLCLEQADGRRTCNTAQKRPGWKSTSVHLPSEYWKWEGRDCPIPARKK